MEAEAKVTNYLKCERLSRKLNTFTAVLFAKAITKENICETTVTMRIVLCVHLSRHVCSSSWIEDVNPSHVLKKKVQM